MSYLISVIIPNFNRCELINETLQSLINQTYKHWEAIIVDDGSTDDSVNTISDFTQADSRIKLLKRDRLPKGAPTCRNIGLENAKGEYIVFLDSDDILAPYCLEERMKQFKENPNNDFIVFSMLSFTKSPGDSTILWNVPGERSDMDRFLSSDVPWSVTCPIWKKESLLKIGLWDEDALSWQDWEFHIRALINGLKYSRASSLPDSFVRRSNNERISKGNISESQLESRLKLFNKIYLLFLSNGLIDNYKKKLFAKLLFSHAEKNVIENSSELLLNEYLKSIKKFSLLGSFDYNYIKLYLSLLLVLRRHKIPFTAGLTKKIFSLFKPSFLNVSSSSHLKVNISESDLNLVREKLGY